jgi:hypothetical protein
MNEIIKGIKDEKGYRMENMQINIICYLHHTVLIADNKFSLKILSLLA